MRSGREAVVWVLVGVGIAGGGAGAQALPAGEVTAAPARSNDVAVSPVMGLNFAASYTAQHDSATGWANIVTPSLSYRFNRHLLVDAVVPWYLTVQAFVPTMVKGKTTYPLDSARSVTEDMSTSVHLEGKHGHLLDLGTATVAYPTGNARYGLSAKQVTYNVTNHMEYALGPFTPDIEFGEGNSSQLANQAVRKTYVAAGPLANFQVGTDIDLPFSLDLDLEAYEELPLGNGNVYGTVTKKGKNGKTRTTSVLEGTGAAEDNGFLAELDVPVGGHFVLLGTYDRSLVQGLDTAAVGVTWTLRRPKLGK